MSTTEPRMVFINILSIQSNLITPILKRPKATIQCLEVHVVLGVFVDTLLVLDNDRSTNLMAPKRFPSSIDVFPRVKQLNSGLNSNEVKNRKESLLILCLFTIS